MRIAIIGYGKMGKAIEQIALSRNHSISAIIDKDNNSEINTSLALSTDVAIEFSSPDAAKQNILNCISNKIPVVSGTTGWNFNRDEMHELCIMNKTSFFHASNFSIGVNIFMSINEKLASLLSGFDNYSAKIEETHHIHKLDKPSGTAISLAHGIIKNNRNYVKWELNSEAAIPNLPIESFREGEVFGNHSIIWENDIDKIRIEHSAKSRKGFAQGAVLAAEFVKEKKGLLTMNDLLKF